MTFISVPKFLAVLLILAPLSNVGIGFPARSWRRFVVYYFIFPGVGHETLPKETLFDIRLSSKRCCALGEFTLKSGRVSPYLF